MQRKKARIGRLVAACVAQLAALPALGAAADEKNSAALLQTYCQDCHNSVQWSGGLALDVFDLKTVASDAKVWEQVVRKMRGRMMPPPTEKQPSQAAVDQLVRFLEGRIDEAAARHPEPGFVSLHRLNRTEYERAVADILAVKFDAGALLPKEVRNEGFDNIANILKVSPSFLDQYLWAAREVSVLAVGDPKSARPGTTYRGGSEDSRMYVPGMPLGTRGGVVAMHVFPVDGEYTFNVGGGGGFGGGRGGGGPPGAGPAVAGGPSRAGGPPRGGGPPAAAGGAGGDAARSVLLIDGVPVWDNTTAPPEMRSGRGIKVQMKAGPHKVVVASPAGVLTEGDEMLKSLNPGGGGRGGGPGGGGGQLEIVAPANAMINGLLETPSRTKIFICRPKSAADEAPCARRILSRIARDAFRRPVADDDLVAPMRFYDAARRSGSFDAGIQQGIMAILASPKFLYRAEEMPAGLAPGQSYRISDLDLASRLAFFLWSTGPDETLLQLAEGGRLHEPKVLEAQVKRMLADDRSRSLVTNFAFQWLVIDKADEIMPDAGAYPEFDAGLRAAMKKEVELFIDSVLRSEQSVVNLLTADHTFVNERLALHYGLRNIRGNEFRRITWQDPNRFGLLGKGNILLATSYGDRTSPVIRGAWILENLTGTPPTPPPPGVEALAEGKKADGRKLTVRERLELHRAQPSCNSCHGIMDPLGLALENFDAIGKWREVDRASLAPIDAMDRLHTGQPVKGPADLRAALAERPAQFVQTLTEKLMMFALGRTVEYHDMPAVRAIVREERALLAGQYESMLDMVAEDAESLKRTLGERDRAELGDYLETVREIERRVAKAAQSDLSKVTLPAVPPQSMAWDDQLKLMFDIMGIAWQANLTRILNFMMAAEVSGQTYSHIQIPDAFHPLSHHANDPAKIQKLIRLQTYHSEHLARFLTKLQEMPDGDGTMFDHLLMMYGSNMSNSDRHNQFPLPVTLIGGACGRLKGGQHLKYPDKTPLANLLLTVLDRAGTPVEKVGDSTAVMAEV